MRSGMGMGALGLGAMAQATTGNPLSPRPPHFRPRAKRIIHLFMNGGPSHVDTFDPKPELARYAGKMLPMRNLPTERKTGAALPSPFKFAQHGQSGLPVSEIFPHTAKHADEICVLRSMRADVPNHEPSLMLMNCGESLQVRPSMGSWLTYGLGTENQNLPGFIAMCPGYPIQESQNWQCGFLPGSFQGTYVDTRKTKVEDLIAHIRNPRLSLEQQRRQLDLLRRINERHAKARQNESQLEARIHSFELAFRMQRESAEVLNTSRETAATKTLYGIDKKESSNFGMQCLLARRFAERGVRFIQVTHSQDRMPQEQWDQHSNMKFCLERNCAEIDQPVAGLLKDLKSRGMLHDTLVIWGGEFGRTPTAQNTDGRDHNPEGFTMWMAGGGVKGGLRYGATDDYGYYAAENKVHVHDLHATILHLLGLNHERLTYRYGGRDFRLTDVHGEIVHGILA